MVQTVIFFALLGLSSAYQRRTPRFTGEQDLPLNHPLLLQRTAGVEQVHVMGGNSFDEVQIVWTTSMKSNSAVRISSADSISANEFTGSAEVYSVLLNPPSYEPDEIKCSSANYTQPECYYTSPFVHSVKVGSLQPSTLYHYAIYDPTISTYTNFSWNFTTTPNVTSNAVSFGVVGDLGQTTNSSETVRGLWKMLHNNEIDAILHAGDLAYADGLGARWDSYARLGEYLWSSIPAWYVGGNHEVANGGENWVHYKARYPNSHEKSGSNSFLWHSFETGPAHVIMLCSYADYSAASLQQQWLEADLQSINRDVSPWVIAMWHTPWYTSNAHHPMKEGSAMREAMEELLVAHHVDIVFTGHVHAYERTSPVYQQQVDCVKGITHITIGDGGNREQFATPWVEPQPAWSALREYAYGMGKLQIVNATSAHWQWLRNDDSWNPAPSGVVGDEVWLSRESKCQV